ncbi:hypothetical protein AGMMS49992_19670 [Clostridia bacterium]|nr:hypothetical protein AGMMS49992_19670 [Clostridia bacterium]
MQYRTIIDNSPTVISCQPKFGMCYDIVVAGLGTAGAIAMLAAARLGLTVFGFDRATGMGGMGTLGSVLDYYYGQGGGLQEDVNGKCSDMVNDGGYVTSQRPDLNGRESFPGAVKSYVLEYTVLDNKATIRYETIAIGVYLEGKRIVGLRCWDGSRCIDIQSKIVVDATGDAGFSRMAGARMNPARLTDNTHQYYSKTKTLLFDSGFVMGLWHGCGRMDAQNPQALSKGVLQAMLFPFERRHISSDTHTVYESPIYGFREGPRIRSKEVLTLDDVMNGKSTAEPIFYAASHVDSFNHDLALEDDLLQDFYICGLDRACMTVAVPMGSLIPEEMDGLLAAGRCIGVDHNIAACVRMKRDMEKSGEASAALAYASIRTDVHPREVPYDAVASMLRQSGCLNDNQYNPWYSLEIVNRAGSSPSSMRDALCRSPLFAMWVARSSAYNWTPYLKEWVDCHDNDLCINSALTLGMIGDAAALPSLRSICAESLHKKIEYGTLWKAICLLGRYAIKSDAKIMAQILQYSYFGGHKDESYCFNQDQRAFIFLAAEMSLLKIALRNMESNIIARSIDCLHRIILDPVFVLTLSVGLGNVDLTDTARRMACCISGYNNY